MVICLLSSLFFFFNDPAPTEIYTLSLHDALPISFLPRGNRVDPSAPGRIGSAAGCTDRKSTRLNSSHRCISYAVFCLKKKKNKHNTDPQRKFKTHNHAIVLNVPSHLSVSSAHTYV